MHSRFAAVACAALLASGCAALVPDAERIDIQQGNLLSSEDIAQLETGLTRSQVRERVGAPILASPWRPNRWDYVYYRTENLVVPILVHGAFNALQFLAVYLQATGQLPSA